MLLRTVCNHPHIIEFYGVTKYNNEFYMVLQFADGGNLREYLRKNFTKLQWTNKIRIAKEIVHGLMFLHNHNIIHRDLHSKNVLIHQEQAKIADFGLSKQIDETSMTSNSIIRGMTAYIEPKCFLNQKYKRNKKSDVYSIGVILWEISSGKPPYQDISAFMLASYILNGKREKPIENTPTQYINLYEQCWDIDPVIRPETELIFETLKQLISNEKSIPNNNLIENIDFSENSPSDKQDYAIHSNSHVSSLYLPDTISIDFSTQKNINYQEAGWHGLKNIRVVVAIDFGTYSSFAYSNMNVPYEIITNYTWPNTTGVLKTNTALKYDQDFNVEAWGSPALVQKPSRRAERKNITSKTVELFKLHLANIPEKEKPMLPKGLDYKKAITDYLTEMGKLIKETIVYRWPNVNFMEQVLVIMTVPTEFTKQANDTIRECAYRAGLISNQYTEKLQLCTEPEAAAIYCMRTFKEIMSIEVGNSLMIVDCGDGTVDLTTWELLKHNRLGEITERSSDFCGSTYVDKEFIKFLRRKVSDSAVNLFYENHYGHLQYMMQEFCRRVKLPFTGNRIDFKTCEFDIEKLCPVLKQYVTGTPKIKLEDDDWIIDLKFEDVKAMFDPVIGKIIRLINGQLNTRVDSGTCAVIFLVGGFSESKFLKTRIKQEFGSQVRNIIVPKQPIAAIVRGAVYYGLNLLKLES
ncbi:actin-like ATPase domain-containing protein [Gigaspora margarita]|nr:actin-like ATPase domain-containing protein [Gigaspora margarita]